MIKYLLLILTLCLSFVCGCKNYSENVDSKPSVDYEILFVQGRMNFVYIEKDKQTDRNVYMKISNYICDNKDFCAVLFWNDRDKVPSSLPMSDEQVKEKTAHYNKNVHTGLNRLRICQNEGC